jgi:predicted nuclease of predicted toxin-antitoxin system
MAEDPGDELIIQQAFQDKSILITLDKDFGELAVFKGFPRYGIVRLVNHPARQQAKVCQEILHRYQFDLQSGAIITVEKSRIRIRSKAD